MRVMGLDLSLTGTGVVVLDEGARVVYHDTIDNKLRGMERLRYIRSEVGNVLAACKPQLVCVEGYNMGLMANNLASLGELGGIVRLLMHNNGFRYFDVAPTQLKKFILGKGAGEKDMIVKEVLKRWGWDAPNNDEADAYGLARIALNLASVLPESGLTVPQIEVLEALTNPQPKKKKKKGA